MRQTNFTEGTLRALLRARHPEKEWFFAGGVRNSTGYVRGTVRTADALAMSLWPSRGLHLHGFEIKSARNDWLRELKDPEKAEAIAAYCDFWHVVGAGDDSEFGPGIIKASEVPPNWGWLAPVRKADKSPSGFKTTLVEMIPAKPLKPIPMDRVFLAAILKKAKEDVPGKEEVDAAIQKVRQEEHARYDALFESHENSVKDTSNAELERLKKRVADFEEASGVNISTYFPTGRIGKAVEIIQHNGKERVAEDLRRNAEQMQRSAELMLEAATELDGTVVEPASEETAETNNSPHPTGC